VKNFLTFTLALLFIGCGIPEEDHLKVVDENRQLKETVARLEEEIKQLKETDQYYYQSGADEFNSGNFQKAIDWMNNLKLKFPQSNLIVSADKLVKDSNAAIAAMYQKEKQSLNSLIQEVSKLELEDAIAKLENYVISGHPEDLVKTATQQLSKYQQDYEKVRAEREVERSVGIRLVEYSTNWAIHGLAGSQLFSPQVQLKFNNISGQPLSEMIEIQVNFIKTADNEVFGDATSYFIGYGDTPLQPNYTKTSYLHSNVGYKQAFDFYELNSLPNLEANIYINKKLYRKIPVAKKY
jgi:hypothetical protein